ncbi:hypothetical protein evm_001087 [Chilo suppressalis]|nr:hypothetical protein evm_001087 [Chilo suppressalis]
MRYITLCVLYALIIHKGGAASDNDFRPIPIPLEQWSHEKREARVGTLHETMNTDKATTVAAVPAHYWEDALRHSVYLTLVRDKIDQLIAKGIVVSPDTKPEQHTSKEVDDHDLWEKIKKAPFDRIVEDDHASFGDVTIMAKGRLLEEDSGFRFAEDERSREDCKDDKCMKGVKAFWSVKRVRQRDEEISTGKYHYELTFSVNSQPPKKERKQHETPIRTFTVRENPPDIIVAKPEGRPYYQAPFPQAPRPQRAIWFHRNIASAPRPSQARYHHQSLDRIFSSLFFDDDTPDGPPPRFKPNHYAPPIYPHHSKLGYAGPLRDQNHQKKIMQYPYTPNTNKYSRPPIKAPPTGHVQHHYIDIDSGNYHHNSPPSDHRHISPSNIVKTTRPAVLPTPSVPNFNNTIKNTSFEFYSDDQLNSTQNITTQTDSLPVYKTNNKPRPLPGKNHYFPERIRPPIYNAPPGVFLTMDKKPFKPMPPLKFMHGSKPAKRPSDFRPSPQILDGKLVDPDSSFESAFRPILLKNITDNNDTEENDTEIIQDNKHLRKHVVKKPPKKHENIKSQRVTTTAPDIITVESGLEDNDTMQWANLLGAFTKTTPMDSQKDKQKIFESTTQPISLDNLDLTVKYITTAMDPEEIISTSTTASLSKKRTRPPHKFAKPDKIKKYKRISTTTTVPEKAPKKKTVDLTPQESSANNGGNKSWQPKNKTLSSTTSAITTSTSTTTQKSSPLTTQVTTTSTTSRPSTTTIEVITKPTQQRNKNRFRQTTLLIKGTSVKHDRWSNNSSSYNNKLASTSGKNPTRRKGSNFHGYRQTSTPKYSNTEEFTKQSETEISRRIESSTTSDSYYTPLSTQRNYEETAGHYINNESTVGYSQNQEDDNDSRSGDIEMIVNNKDDQEIDDHSEFIFDLTTKTPNDQSNEINEEEFVTEQSIVATSHSVSKNRTKCKKKKHQHLAPTQSALIDEEASTESTMAISTKSSSNLDILDQLLGSLTYDESTATPKKSIEKYKELDDEESKNHEKYMQIDEDFEDFLDDLGNRHRHSDEKGVEDYEDDEKEPSFEDEVSPFDNDDVNEPRKSNDKDYDEYHERSYSLLELMAME